MFVLCWQVLWYNADMLILLAIAVFVLIPAAEIYVFIQVGGELGAGTVVWLTILSAILGVYFVKRQGFSLYSKLRQKVSENKMPADELFSGLCLAVAGVMLFLPGFITDGLGALLLLPPVRTFLRTFIVDSVLESYTFGLVNTDTIEWGKEKVRTRRETKIRSENGVVEADFEVIEEEEKPSSKK